MTYDFFANLPDSDYRSPYFGVNPDEFDILNPFPLTQTPETITWDNRNVELDWTQKIFLETAVKPDDLLWRGKIAAQEAIQTTKGLVEEIGSGTQKLIMPIAIIAIAAVILTR